MRERRREQRLARAARPGASARSTWSRATPGERQEVFCTEGRHEAPERDVHHRRAHGRHRLGPGRERRRLRHGDRDGARAHLHDAGRADRRSIRFALWNNEETGLNGAHAYVEQREAMQGKEVPAGSGKYPEPKWLGMIQHDMMMFDHGPPTRRRHSSRRSSGPKPTSTSSSRARRSWRMSRRSSRVFQRGEREVRDGLPGRGRTAHDEHGLGPVQGSRSGDQPARERARSRRSAASWDPTRHQPTDVLTTFTDKDFMLGLNVGTDDARRDRSARWHDGASLAIRFARRSRA